MKLSRIATTLLGTSLFFAVGAFAQEKSTLTLAEKVTIQGTELKPGKYNVQWDGAGPNVQVRIFQGKNNLGTFPATVVAKDTSNAGAPRFLYPTSFFAAASLFPLFLATIS